eukprot:431131-Hanusia_phi.AAC.1
MALGMVSPKAGVTLMRPRRGRGRHPGPPGLRDTASAAAASSAGPPGPGGRMAQRQWVGMVGQHLLS